MFKNVTIIVLTLLLTNYSLAGEDFPALYQAENFRLSSLEQFFKRWEDVNPNYEHRWSTKENIEYRDQVYSGYVLETDGIKNGSRQMQTLTYINFLPGLIKLVFVESKDCVMGEAINEEGEWESDWRCETFGMPASAYGDLFLLEDENVDIEALSEAWGKEIVPLQNPVAEDVATEAGLKTLGDLRKLILDNGGSWHISETQWAGSVAKPLDEPIAALLIKVEAQADNVYTAKQSFLYVIEGNLLRLKEIDGVLCRYVERVEKEICDPIYQPTPGTPFPMELANTLDLSHAESEEPSSVLPDGPRGGSFSCGNLGNNFSLVLKFHFERSIFGIKDIEEYRRFFKNFAFIADPEGILLSLETREKYSAAMRSPHPYDPMLAQLMNEFEKGRAGDCSALLPFIEELREEFLVKTAEVTALFNKLKQNNFQVESLGALSPLQQKILDKMQSQPIKGHSPASSLDVSSGQLRQYLTKSLDRLSHAEWFVTAALASQDDYSVVFENNQQTQATLNGHSSGLYYGVSIQTGVSGAHYFAKVHPEVNQIYGIEVGDKILEINGEEAKNLSYDSLDRLLVDKETPLELVVENSLGEKSEFLFQARALDPLDSFYQLQVERIAAKKTLVIKLASFEAGLAALLRQKIQTILNEEEIEALVLDLQGNPGGNTQEAMNVMSLFVKNTPIALYTMGSRFSDQVRDFQADPELFLNDQLPLVVLIDEKSKSAAEIVAGNLKDLGRSLTLGTRSFGKLVNQYYSPLELSDGKKMGLLVTSLEFFSPQGISRNQKGVWPDLLIEEPVGEPNQDGNSPGRDLDVSLLDGAEAYSTFWSPAEIENVQRLVDQESLDLNETLETLFE